ncbi:MAG: sodium:proton antiporter [Phycisphaerae bacterium]|nr:MAG: sodium:proton antiporter [Phycisphaerae bacterium]
MQYGGWVLLPALSAIVLAIVTRQVIPALFIGTFVAAMMLCRISPDHSGGALSTVIDGAADAMAVYVVGAVADADHAKVMLFTLMIGGMVGVVNASGGTRAMVEIIARRAKTRRQGQCTVWLAGLVVFFDDYANTMIVGPTMQPLFDRLKISRAKLAYIVDSTAAPVASIALVGTWVGAEIGYIDGALKDIAKTGTPAFLSSVDAWGAFLNSIPYRFYAILALVMVFIVGWTGRDFGAMRRHEALAATGDVIEHDDADERTVGRFDWLLAAIPVLLLVAVTGVLLLYPAYTKARADGTPLSWKTLFDDADSYNAILFGAMACLIAAIALAVTSRRSKLQDAVDGMLEGMSRMFPAIVVLVLAWALSQSSVDLKVGEVVSDWLVSKNFAMHNLPVVVFACAAGVSFATGTSWGTMGILCPVVVRVAADMGADLPAETALPLFYASVGSVLAGAIFGDHCSPISDTTVLSSAASGCNLQDHVWTQLPYALVTAAVSMATGDILCARMQLSPWLGIAFGIFILAILVATLGRKTIKS